MLSTRSGGLKLIDEKRIIQTYQPVITMSGDQEDDTKEIYKTGLLARLSQLTPNTSVIPDF